VRYEWVSTVAEPPVADGGTKISMRDDGIMRNDVAHTGLADVAGMLKEQVTGENFPPTAFFKAAGPAPPSTVTPSTASTWNCRGWPVASSLMTSS